ncbi:phage antirepressor KilAC domain-containing protein [Salipiger bermudensis]|uniref:phage antirepressor KilAC domain-containing protein n=1 Tax=Salipiger bermudensis TaxID=344736 RepID=UPI001CD44B99|nr:phage antirepressor KilAC domain-containing protein [Salipiger bermudensis]MCA0961148.1 phage antirepressor KilAC domain-containing protein [Salipiger bermudensis]
MNPTSAGVPEIFGAAQALTMSSREIAELLESRHDKVKQSIERLVARGVIVQPPMGDEQDTDAMGRKRTTSVCRLEKRDTYIVVAQMSPEFTAQLVDRWQELEAAQPAPAMLTGPQLMSAALIEAQQTLSAQAAQIEDMREDVEADERLTKADGSLNVTEAAKNLGVRPKDLFTWLSTNGWIYKRPGGNAWLGYQSKTNTGYLEHKSTTVLRADGSEKITEQVRVTAKGLSRLARLMPGVAREA